MRSCGRGLRALMGRLPILVLLIAVVAPAQAVAAPRWTGLVANNVEPFDSISTFDAGTASFGENIHDGADNTWVGVSPDGTKAYASLVHLFTGLRVIDLSSKTVVDSASTAIATFWGAIAPDGKTAYLAGSDKIVPIDLTTSPPTVKTAIPLTGGALVAISPDGGTLYVTGSSGVTPVNLSTGAVGNRIATGAGALGVAVSPDGSTLWVANHDAKTVSRIRLSDGSVENITIAAGHPGYLSMSADGSRVWLTLLDEHRLASIDTTDNSIGAVVDTGGVEARGVQVTPDGKTVYVSDGAFNGTGSGNQVTPVDATTNPPTVKPTITGFADPVWVAMTPDQPPSATFTVASAPAGQPTSFDASPSQPGSTPITSYAWDFGDGSTATTTNPTIAHTYGLSGTYQASVAETDAAGTSTTPVYTGQQMLRNGGPSAQVSKSVIVTSAPAPAVSVSASTLDFGDQAPARQGTPQSVTVTNVGNANLSIASARLGGSDPQDFVVTQDRCGGATVAPQAACATSVAFKPTATGQRDALLQFADNASGSPHTVFLHGVGNNNGTLVGQVLDSTSPGPPGAQGAAVSVCTYSTRAICRSTNTDSGGNFRVGGLPADSYQVEVLPAQGNLFPGSAVVDIAAGTTSRQTFFLHAPQGLPPGFMFNGTGGSGPTSSFWTSPADLEVRLRVLPHLLKNRYAGTVVTFYAAPDASGNGRASLGSLTVIYWYDSAGIPRFIGDVPKNVWAGWRGSSAGSLGRWSLALRDPPAVAETDVTNAIVDGVLTPPANGPFFHGGSVYQVSQYTFGFFPSTSGNRDRSTGHAAGGSGTTGGHGGFPVPKDLPPGGTRSYLPSSPSCPAPSSGPPTKTPPKVYKDNRLEDAFPNGSRVDRSDPNEPWYIDENGQRHPQDPNWGWRDPSNPSGPPSSIFSNPDGTGFTVDANGDMHPVPQPNQGDPNSPIEPLHPGQPPVPTQNMSDNNVYGQPSANTPPPSSPPETNLDPGSKPLEIPWQDVPGAPRATDKPNAELTPPGRRLAHLACDPPPPPAQPDPFDNYIDPSGDVVTTHNIPIAGAKVELLRTSTVKGHLSRVPNGNRVMSPANRRNPDHTDIDGHFGWDVIAGFYRVRATHPGCTSTKGHRPQAQTPVLAIPPPVIDLRLTLSCPRLHRKTTKIRLKAKKVAVGQVILIAKVDGRGRRPTGIVKFSIEGRPAINVPLVRRDRTVSTTVPRIRRHTRIIATYQGNGIFAPSRGAARAP
jgi:hypothetical protein